MTESISRRLGWLVSLAIALVAFGSPAAVGQAGQQTPGTADGCELLIDGEFIQQLVLEADDGRTEQLNRPSGSVSLPAGEYRVRQVDLKGDYHWYAYGAAEKDWFSLVPGQPYALRVGGLLTPTVKATRQGRFLVLDYQLLDAGQRNYTTRSATDPPRFTIRKDGQQIASGQFEYG